MNKINYKELNNYFLDKFVDYYRMKKYNGSLDLKEDPSLAERVGTKYFNEIKDITNWDMKKIKNLFHYLEFKLQYFVDPDKFESTVRLWVMDEAGTSVYVLSEEFCEFMEQVKSACQELNGAEQTIKYSIIDALCNTLRITHKLKRPFSDKPLEVCIKIFWNWLRINKIDEVIIHSIEFKIQESTKRATEKINEMTQGRGFTVQQQQIEINNIVNQIGNQEKLSSAACPVCKKEILKSEFYISRFENGSSVKYHTKCCQASQKDLNNAQ